MKFELNTYHRNTPDQELLDDLKKVAAHLNKDKIRRDEYTEYGIFNAGTLEKRFGTWNKAIESAGLNVTVKRNLSDDDLFDNIEEIWIKLGRQPLREEIKKPNSLFSSSTYERRFGTWRKALEAFVEFINSDEPSEIETKEPELIVDPIKPEKEIIRHTTKRNISKRLQVQVLMRDGNKCRLCGIIVTGENIHFDHIKPWSKGGETVLENLQVLCAEHNLAKGDLEYSSQIGLIT